MSAAQCRWLTVILLISAAVGVRADSILLDSSILSTRPHDSNSASFMKGTPVSLDSLESPLAVPRETGSQLSLAIFFQPFPVRLMSARSARRETNLPALLQFLQKLIMPNRSPCQVECSARCEHTVGCPLLQDRSAKND